jgi:hypothetical protein
MRRVRTTQPQAPVPINWGNDLSKGLIFSTSPGLAGALEDVTKAGLIASPVAAQATSSFGVGLSQSTGYAYYDMPLSSNAQAYTLLALAGNTSESRRVTALMLGDEVLYGNAQVALALNCDQSGAVSAGTLAFFVYGGSGTFGAQVQAAGYMDAVGTPRVYGAIRNGAAVSLWVNGVKVASNSTGASVLTNIAQTVYVSGSAVDASRYCQNHVASRIWNRALADDEMAQVSANIWQTYQDNVVPWRPSVAPTMPVLSLAQMTNITTTGGQPRVTAT